MNTSQLLKEVLLIKYTCSCRSRKTKSWYRWTISRIETSFGNITGSLYGVMLVAISADSRLETNFLLCSINLPYYVRPSLVDFLPRWMYRKTTFLQLIKIDQWGKAQLGERNEPSATPMQIRLSCTWNTYHKPTECFLQTHYHGSVPQPEYRRYDRELGSMLETHCEFS